MTIRLAGAPPPVVGVALGPTDGEAAGSDGLGTADPLGATDGALDGVACGADGLADAAGGESVPRIGSPPISDAAGVARLSPNPVGGA
jgi:hypothetical protein